MIVRRRSRRRGWIRALVSMWMMGAAAPAVWAGDDVAGPAWLNAPQTRGPVAASLGLDTHHAWWAIDAALPLRLGTPRLPDEAPNLPALGLGLSIAGQGGSDSRRLRYSALLDRRSRRTGEWLGFSTGGGSPGLDTRLQFGTGLWRSLGPIEMEAGVVSSFVGYQDRQESHWGFYRDSLHWRDTTTYQNVDRSGLWHTAQSALRLHYRRMELAASGGVTVGERIQPRRWAQVVLNLHASPRVTVTAAYGQRPVASMAFDPSARPQTMIGVQLAPWATIRSPSAAATVGTARQWSAQSIADGRIMLRVRCPRAARVEVTGDFTDWAPVALLTTAGGWWETTLAIPPGLHQVQIRLDGGPWQVPPGLPSAQLEFAGAVGVLVID